MSRDEIVIEALRLPEDQRVTIALTLLGSIEPLESAETAAAWETEIKQRIAAYDRGEVQAVPAAKVFEEMECQLNG